MAAVHQNGSVALEKLSASAITQPKDPHLEFRHYPHRQRIPIPVFPARRSCQDGCAIDIRKCSEFRTGCALLIFTTCSDGGIRKPFPHARATHERPDTITDATTDRPTSGTIPAQTKSESSKLPVENYNINTPRSEAAPQSVVTVA